MRNSAYTVHLSLEPLPATLGNRWEHTPATRAQQVASRKADIGAANKSGNRFVKSAAFKALNNLNKMGV